MKLAEIGDVEINSPMLYNSLIYNVKFIDIINFDWAGLQHYEYDIDHKAFLNRLISGMSRVLQQENPFELDLRYNVSSCNVISIGNILVYDKERLYRSFGTKMFNVNMRNMANSILITRYWQRQFLTDKDTIINFQSTDKKIMHLRSKCIKEGGATSYQNAVFVLEKDVLYYQRKLFNKFYNLLVLPTFLAKSVLSHLHFTRRLHVSDVQLSRYFCSTSLLSI